MSSNTLIRCAPTYQTFIRKMPSCMQVRYLEEGTKPPDKDKVDKMTMPGMVHPEKLNEEGYFTQKAKQLQKALKKKLEKPKAEK